MADLELDDVAMQQLQAVQKDLLDTIDSLRTLRVGQIVDLPQIVVVGDQSSGKSSVLEAISRVRFPIHDNVCTRFATELVLRAAPKTRVDVSIEPGNGDDSSSGAGAASFHETSFNKDQLPDIIERAKEHMGLGPGSANFSEDILRINICGPGMPQLTLVDLPGFYHSANRYQSARGKVVVDRLATRYMKQAHSIILAIVAAPSKTVMQQVLEKVELHDPKKERTLGIVTKPDLLVANSSDEKTYLRIAKNKEDELKLNLGWHVLRNRSEEEASSTDDQRDAAEATFFDSGAWQTIPARDRGIASLRIKLSEVLCNHIKLSLPNVIKDIEQNIRERSRQLKELGESREKRHELQHYLVKIATRFQDLARDGVRGTYADDFFGGMYPEAANLPHDIYEARKIRALARNMNHTFNLVMLTKGSRRAITWPNGYQHPVAPILPEDLKALAELYSFEDPSPVPVSEVIQDLDSRASKNQGTEFPGSGNDLLALALFRDQSKPWESIARHHVALMCDKAKIFTEELLKHIVTSDSRSRDALVSECIDPFFREKGEILEAKVEELLWHYQEGYSLVLEAEFRRQLQTFTLEHVKTELKAVTADGDNGTYSAGQLRWVMERFRASSEFASEKIVDQVMTYYDICMRTFTDNVIILAVENCLMRKLPNILTPEMVLEMDDDMLQLLAGESEEIRTERARLTQELGALTDGLSLCQQFRRRSAVHNAPASLPQSVVAKPILSSIDRSEARTAEVSQQRQFPRTPERLGSSPGQLQGGLSPWSAASSSARTQSSGKLSTDSTPNSSVSSVGPSQHTDTPSRADKSVSAFREPANPFMASPDIVPNIATKEEARETGKESHNNDEGEEEEEL